MLTALAPPDAIPLALSEHSAYCSCAKLAEQGSEEAFVLLRLHIKSTSVHFYRPFTQATTSSSNARLGATSWCEVSSLRPALRVEEPP